MAKLSNSSSTTTQQPGKSYLLSVTPVEYSLTEGTNIPAPENTPPRSPTADLAPPPTPGRGPLNSHPTTPPHDDSAMEVDPPAARRENGNENGHGAPAARIMSSDGADSFKTPTSPASAAQHSSSSPQQQAGRRPSGVRKLLSLSNLRSSFSSSRTSLAIPRSSNDTYGSTQHHQPSNYNPSLKRPSSPSMQSTTASSLAPSHQQPGSQYQAQPRLRQRKSNSNNWFKRKSGLFLLNSNGNGGGELDAVDENSAYRPDTRESKRVKPVGVEGRERTPPPMIPEIGLGRWAGSGFGGGDLGWDEGSFKR